MHPVGAHEVTYMNRRTFLTTLMAVPLAMKTEPVPQLSLIPSMKQMEFFGSGVGGGKSHYMYGIPYHQHNTETGDWQGFDRS